MTQPQHELTGAWRLRGLLVRSTLAVIAADKGVPYGSVVHVIDLVKTNGVTSFALNIERVPTPEEGP